MYGKVKDSFVKGLVFLLGVVVFVMAVTTDNVQASSKVLHWSETAEMQTLDPSLVEDQVSSDIIANSNEGLYRLGKNAKPENALATSTKVSKDGLKYTFTLRKNAKWSNGDKVTAQDFVYSWRRTVNPKTASAYSYLFEGIKNADDIINSKKSYKMLGVKADGKYKLVVTLEKKIPYFKLLMGFTVFYPQNQKAVEKFGKKYGTAAKYMVYNGPFKVVGWTGSNLQWKLVKNQDYWDKKDVKLNKITFQVTKSTTTSYNLYQSGKLDQTYLDATQARELKNNKEFVAYHQARTNYLEYNQTKKALKNKKIRQAIAYAINRKQLVNKVLGNGSMTVTGLVSKDLASYNGTDFSKAQATGTGAVYNLQKAKKLWKEGLKELGVSKLSLSLLGDDDDVSKSVTTYLQSQLEQHLSGLSVSVSNVPKKTRISKSQSGDFDLVLSGWAADFSDPISFVDMFTTNGSYNNGKWSNTTYDNLIAAAKGTDASNEKARWSDMVKASQLLNNDQAIAPLYQLSQAAMLKSDVKGIIYNTAGVQFNWKNAYVK
ncbi:peptide ABC transporter substrate-binding protein [Ligilactobacillus ubinensis]